MATSFTISYGFGGGKALGKKLRKLMKARGYSFHSETQSDIVIAHSAGCWLIPPETAPKLTFFIGMPLTHPNARRAFLQANRGNIWAFAKNRHALRGLYILLGSTYYALTQPRRNFKITRQVQTAKPHLAQGSQFVFITNQDDPWPKSDQLQEYLEQYDWAFISLPGSHDNIWENPERYVAIIDHYARLLA